MEEKCPVLVGGFQRVTALKNFFIGEFRMWLLLLADEQRPCPRLGGPERGAHGGTLAEPWDVRSRATAAAEVGPKAKDGQGKVP